MRKKFTYLFLALLLPGLIFVFLKRCGRNEFDIPVYFTQNVDSLNAICGTSYPMPYALPDTVLRKIGWDGANANLFVFEDAHLLEAELSLITDSFGSKEYNTIEITPARFGEAAAERWASCVFFIRKPWNVILIDHEKRIRGYYALGSREETDRLILEMKILLKKY